MYPPVALSDFAEEKRADIATRLRALATGAGVRATEIVRLGRAWHEIVQIAREEKVDMLVIATHGYTGLRHALLGSVAEKVVRHASCPVLIVRPDENAFV
jgi:nucleotide-binding universal stress UspA family protein